MSYLTKIIFWLYLSVLQNFHITFDDMCPLSRALIVLDDMRPLSGAIIVHRVKDGFREIYLADKKREGERKGWWLD